MTFAARTLGYLSAPTEILNTTLTIGTSSVVAGYTARGFNSAAAAAYTPTTWGSLTSASTSDGYTVVSVYDDRDTTSPAYAAVVSISGFGADPGQSYLYNVTANSVTKTGASATAYSYSGGRAIWSWEDTTTAPLFGFGTSGTTTLIVKKS